MTEGFIPGDYKNFDEIGVKEPDGFTLNSGKKYIEGGFNTDDDIDNESEPDSESEYAKIDYDSSVKDEDSEHDTDTETEVQKNNSNIFLQLKRNSPKKIENVKILQEEDDFASED